LIDFLPGKFGDQPAWDDFARAAGAGDSARFPSAIAVSGRFLYLCQLSALARETAPERQPDASRLHGARRSLLRNMDPSGDPPAPDASLNSLHEANVAHHVSSNHGGKMLHQGGSLLARALAHLTIYK
jgi:hypothetical protein